MKVNAVPAQYEDKKMRQRILYISDPSRWSRIGAECVASVFADTEIIFWNYGDPPPDEQLARWEGDWILSVKNDLILKEEILKKAQALPVDAIVVVRVFPGASADKPSAVITLYDKQGKVLVAIAAEAGVPIASRSGTPTR